LKQINNAWHVEAKLSNLELLACFKFQSFVLSVKEISSQKNRKEDLWLYKGKGVSFESLGKL